MSTLKDMTLSEKHNYERLIKKGYTHKEAIQMLQMIRDIPQKDKEKTIQAIKRNMMKNLKIEISKEE